MRPRPRRRNSNTSQVENLDKIIELLEKAHAKGDLDDPEIAERIVRLKHLAAQIPAVAGDEGRWLKLVKATKKELYEFSTTLIAKISKEFS